MSRNKVCLKPADTYTIWMFSSMLVSDNEDLFKISTLIGLYWLSFLPGTPNAPYAPSPHDQTSPAIELTIVKY
jgi:hypothetical protein